MTREPLVAGGTLAGAATALAAVAAAFGWHLDSTQATAVVGLVAALVSAGITVAATRGKVTPTADPKDGNGSPLIPMTRASVGDASLAESPGLLAGVKSVDLLAGASVASPAQWSYDPARQVWVSQPPAPLTPAPGPPVA